jgi:hypothetical protein
LGKYQGGQISGGTSNRSDKYQVGQVSGRSNIGLDTYQGWTNIRLDTYQGWTNIKISVKVGQMLHFMSRLDKWRDMTGFRSDSRTYVGQTNIIVLAKCFSLLFLKFFVFLKSSKIKVHYM